MNERALTQKLDSLAGLAPDSDGARRLGSVLRTLDDRTLLALNPVVLARQHYFSEPQLLDLLVLGCRVGLFEYLWKLVCPGCAFVTATCPSINEISPAALHCRFCGGWFEASLDEDVEVWFALHPDVQGEHPSPLSSLARYRRHHFSRSLRLTSQFRRYLQSIQRRFLALQPAQAREVRLSVQSGERYRLISFDRSWAVEIRVVSGKSSPKIPKIEFDDRRCSPARLAIRPGKARLRVHNRGTLPGGALLLAHDPKQLHRMIEAFPPRRTPYASGKVLLNNQVFRDSMRHGLHLDLKLRLWKLTFLFTDLKDSTSLYAREGDGTAYQLIRDHFQLTREAVGLSRGAVVKTMGDAVMATFSRPEDGKEAAVRIVEGIRQLNARASSRKLRLLVGIGLHSGPALLVNANDQLDYFGQTVNVASRVAHRAGPGEIWYTDAVRLSPGGTPGGWDEKTMQVRLKGVGERAQVYWVEAGEDSRPSPEI